MPLLPNQYNYLVDESEYSEDLLYLLATKINSGYFRRRMVDQVRSWQSDPQKRRDSFSSYKTYFHSPRVPLRANLKIFRQIDWEKTVLSRSSRRGFIEKPIRFSQLSNLLKMSGALKEKGKWSATPSDPADRLPERTVGFNKRRALPSAGALYPLEIYVFARNVTGLQSGLYHFNVLHRALSLIGKESAELSLDWLSQSQLFGEPAAIGFVTCIPARSRIKYGPRCLRFILLEAGGLVSHMNLLASAMGLGFCYDGGGYEDKIEGMLEIDGYSELLVTQFAIGHCPDPKARV